jgi:hypothetical protein
MPHLGRHYPQCNSSRIIANAGDNSNVLSPTEWQWSVSSWGGLARGMVPLTGRGMNALPYLFGATFQSWQTVIGDYAFVSITLQLNLQLTPFNGTGPRDGVYDCALYYGPVRIGQTTVYPSSGFGVLNEAQWFIGSYWDQIGELGLVLNNPLELEFQPIMWTDFPQPASSHTLIGF